MGFLIRWYYLDGSYPMQVDHDPPVGSYLYFRSPLHPIVACFEHFLEGHMSPPPTKIMCKSWSVVGWPKTDQRHQHGLGGTQWPWSIDMSMAIVFFHDLLKCCIMFGESFLSSPLEVDFSHVSYVHYSNWCVFYGTCCHLPAGPELSPSDLRLKTKKLWGPKAAPKTLGLCPPDSYIDNSTEPKERCEVKVTPGTLGTLPSLSQNSCWFLGFNRIQKRRNLAPVMVPSHAIKMWFSGKME